MKLTDTTTRTAFSINRPNSSATFVLPAIDDPLRRTTIRIPSGSRYAPDPHWHERYEENFKVVQGSLLVIINGRRRVVAPEDGAQLVPRYAVHQFMRADLDKDESERDTGEVVMEEWTDHANGFKESFFRNIFSTIEEPDHIFGRYVSIQVNMTSAHFDNYDVIIPGHLQWVVTHALYGVNTLLGRLMGFKAWYLEYTPPRLQEVAASG